MSDREKFIPPPPPSPDMFRRATLWRLRNEEHVAALQWLSDLFSSWLDESEQYGAEDSPETYIAQSLRGAVEDLGAIAAHLVEIAEMVDESGLEAQDIILCVKARSWARRVQELADKVDEKLGPSPDQRSAA